MSSDLSMEDTAAARGADMKVRLRKGALFVEPPYDDPATVAAWLAEHVGQVFKLHGSDGAIRLHTLGDEANARREPINITSKSPDPLNLISNFAHTPFWLEGMDYASIEGFWQGLKFPNPADRRRLARLFGARAKDAGFGAPAPEVIDYQGEAIRAGTWDHWRLMERACLAKFTQNEAARAALLATGARPLTHQIGRDSHTIPGVIMAEIWMRIRDGVQHQAES